jgi:hypothetical protein
MGAEGTGVNEPDRIDELANDIDELKTAAEELEENPPVNVQLHTIDVLKEALEIAGDAADELEDQKD